MIFGLLTWIIVEYFVHRLGLHEWYPTEHAKHHQTPNDYSVGPSWTSIGLFFLVLWLLAPLGFALGYTLGYAFYTAVHYLCHHKSDVSFPGLAYLRRMHSIHHRDDTKNFAVSIPFMDILFKTYRNK